MKQLLFLFIAVSFLAPACVYVSHGKRVEGNGHITSQQRNVGSAHKIRLSGSYDVDLFQGNTTALKVEADDNLLPLIITEEVDGWLVVRTADDVNLSGSNKIKISITTDQLEAFTLSGNGNVYSDDKFTGADKLNLRISGNGDMKLKVNTPSVYADISGNGSITLEGETKNEEVHTSGNGDYKAGNLKAEKAELHISGLGNAWVSADSKLDVNISGFGSVYYKGNPALTNHISGGGSIKQIQ